MRARARDDMPFLRKSEDPGSQSTNQEGVRSVQRIDLCFAICSKTPDPVFAF